MQNRVEEENCESGGRAASLSKITVRKSKPEENTVQTPLKAGDITSRLATLSAELDLDVLASPATAAETTHDISEDLPNLDRRDRPDRRQSTASYPQPDRRKTLDRRRNTGWGPTKKNHPDILSYWMEIRRGRRYPSWESLEPDVIGKHWPNCVLVHCNKELGRLQVKYEFTNAVRKAVNLNEPNETVIERIEFTPMIIEWILSLARDVARSGKPAHGTEYFPSFSGEFPLRVIALPLSEAPRSVDHVLCYIQQLR